MATRKATGNKPKKMATKRPYRTEAGSPTATPPSRRWSAKVTSDSTHPPAGLFKQSAKTIAKTLEEKSVSPKGLGQAMQMLSFYENRAGKNLPAERKKTLERAKDIIRSDEGKPAKNDTKKSSAKKSSPTKPEKKSSSTRKASK